VKRVAVDIGGTFTDVVWYDEGAAAIGTEKAMSTADPLEGLTAALAAGGVLPGEISLFLHATTIVTNLLVERRGARVGLLTSAGFRDLLEFQSGMRPNAYDLQWERPAPLVPRRLRLEVPERLDARGRVLAAPDAAAIIDAAASLVADGVDAVAVCFLHAYANPVHEQLAARLIRERWPALHVCCSSDVDPRIREYPRISTTVVNAYALPAFSTYAQRLGERLAGHVPVRFMQSSGGVASLADAGSAPVNLIYSGPAGGVLGAIDLGRGLGLPDLITLDMGGTSTDVCVITDGQAGERDELEIDWGIPIRAQTLDISSIGAGGGSIAQIDAGGALRVGPESARGRPGPACYGLGGTKATVTDANLVLGLVREESPLGRSGIRLQAELARAALRPLADHFGLSVQETAHGVFRTVGANMAQAIREITVFQGIDPRGYTLVAFGGCGPQHAVEVAREIGIRRVIVPALPSVFSARGLLAAELVKSATRTLMCPLDELDAEQLEAELDDLEAAAGATLRDDPVVVRTASTRFASARYRGQSHELAVLLGDLDAGVIGADFEDAHERRYGTRLGDPVEIVDLRVAVTGAVPPLPEHPWRGGRADAAPVGVAVTPGGSAAVYRRSELAAGTRIAGPALIEEADSTTYLPADATGAIDAHGHIRIDLG
jgi:N-methylhydantoinase A